MKIVTVLLAVLLTLIMLYVTHINSLGQPEHRSANANGYSFEITTVPKGIEGTSTRLTVTITGPIQPETRLYFCSMWAGAGDVKNLDGYDKSLLNLGDPVTGGYYVDMSTPQRGSKMYYYFEVVDPSGNLIARFTDRSGKPFVFKAFGHVPVYVLAPHILFMFATFFLVSLASTTAVSVLRGSTESLRPVFVYLFWGATATLLGGIVLGIPMNWFAFRGSWEGVPFGTDATDNKTQLLLIYLIFATLTGLGSLTRGRIGRDLYSAKVLARLAVSSFLFMLFVFLVPHSIQFSPEFTYAFCYSVIGLIAIVYIISLIRAGSRAGATAGS